MKQWLLLACFTGFGTLASAQVRIGPEVGMLLNNYSYKIKGANVSNKLKPGVKAGVVADIKVVEGLYVQTGLGYVSKGLIFTGNYGLYQGMFFKGTETVHYLEIPLNVVYKSGAEDAAIRFITGAGPYLGIVMGGKYEGNGTSTKLNIGRKAYADDLKPLELGVNINAGVQLQNNLFARLNAGIGLTNMMPGGNTENVIRNRNVSFTVGYLF